MMRGRPFLFIGTVMSAWIGARVLILWPAQTAVAPIPTTIARASPPAMAPSAMATAGSSPATAALRLPAALRSSIGDRLGRPEPNAPVPLTDAQILASVGLFYFAEVPSPVSGAGAQPSGGVGRASDLPLWTPRTTVAKQKRWSLDTWSLLRPGPGSGSFGPQLGGSQAGARLGYLLDARRRIAAYVRVSSPLDRGGVEAAAGVQWQPTSQPVAVFAEARRRAGGAVVPVAGLVGGVYRAPLAGGWRLDGYGQAGVIGGKRGEGFADGQARATRPLGTVGPAAFEAGVGAWGGIQRDAARFDLGPTLGVELPVRSGNLRLTLDWRQRVAGHAAPASGPALTLAAGF